MQQISIKLTRDIKELLFQFLAGTAGELKILYMVILPGSYIHLEYLYMLVYNIWVPTVVSTGDVLTGWNLVRIRPYGITTT